MYISTCDAFFMSQPCNFSLTNGIKATTKMNKCTNRHCARLQNFCYVKYFSNRKLSDCKCKAIASLPIVHFLKFLYFTICQCIITHTYVQA